MRGFTVERIAGGVWLVRGGPMRLMNVYLIQAPAGITLFDAGIRQMTIPLAQAIAALGSLKRIVLSHSHPEHRGAAPRLKAPVLCHPAEVEDAEGDGGLRYADFSRLQSRLSRAILPRLNRRWDGGPVRIAATLSEGDEIAGFSVTHLPGHAPGLIGLWRESDRLALVSDAIYTVEVDGLTRTGRSTRPRAPHAAFTPDPARARSSILKLAALEPASVWPGHGDPVVGRCRGQLERAAAT